MTVFSGFLHQLLAGAWITIQVACGALILGLILGLIGATAESSKIKPVRYLAISLISVIRGLPELLVLFFIYFGGALLFTAVAGHYVDISAFYSGIIALALLFGSYASQVFRGAFVAIPIGQIEAARALGLNTWLIFKHVQLPQAWRYSLPGLGNLWLVLLKDTALVSLIGLADLMNTAKLAANSTHQPFTFFIAAAFLYLIMTSISQWILKRLSNKAAEHLRT